MQKLSINLLQEDLIPKKSYWNLNTVALIWLLALILIIVSAVYSGQKITGLKKEFQATQNENNKQTILLTELEDKIAKNRVDENLLTQLNNLKFLLANKSDVLSQLTDKSSTYASGYASAMTELASLHHPEISLQKVKINNSQLTFVGLAKKPDAVPAWLAGFEESVFLSGKAFSHFKLEDEPNGTKFVVSSTVNDKITGANNE